MARLFSKVVGSLRPAGVECGKSRGALLKLGAPFRDKVPRRSAGCGPFAMSRDSGPPLFSSTNVCVRASEAARPTSALGRYTATWRAYRADVAKHLGDGARSDQANRLDGSFLGTAVTGRGISRTGRLPRPPTLAVAERVSVPSLKRPQAPADLCLLDCLPHVSTRRRASKRRSPDRGTGTTVSQRRAFQLPPTP